MSTFIGFDVGLDYKQRSGILKQHHIAVWDVLKRCERHGSLDSAIKPESERANNIAEFLQRHSSIRVVLFNGKKAAAAFNRHILPKLHPPRTADICFMTLPSSSPANARLNVAEKCAIWHLMLAKTTN